MASAREMASLSLLRDLRHLEVSLIGKHGVKRRANDVAEKYAAFILAGCALRLPGVRQPAAP
jgi:hypothetical protein